MHGPNEAYTTEASHRARLQRPRIDTDRLQPPAAFEFNEILTRSTMAVQLPVPLPYSASITHSLYDAHVDFLWLRGGSRSRSTSHTLAIGAVVPTSWRYLY